MNLLQRFSEFRVFSTRIGFTESRRTRLSAAGRWIIPGLIFISLFASGCVKPVRATVPPCPAWSKHTISDYARLLDAEDAGELTPPLYGLHEWLERQVTFCLALDIYRNEGF
ncbi:MAG: hypothetical protein CL793_07555 [Chloroflexi bacterium]|nr:hypothetical protein [Chloroflexota bacterium]